jgi:anaerobic C4-dicarboxylate transporter
MQLKCTLQPTCAIPTPILSILFGRIPQVSTVVKDISEDPSQESKIADDDDEDEAEQTNKDESRITQIQKNTIILFIYFAKQ